MTGQDTETPREKLIDHLEYKYEARSGIWPPKGPFLESTDYIHEDEYEILDTYHDLLDDGVIEEFEGTEGTMVRLVETDEDQDSLGEFV